MLNKTNALINFGRQILQNQNYFYSDFTWVELYYSNEYKRLKLFQSVLWNSVAKTWIQLLLCFKIMPLPPLLVTFSCQNNTKFCANRPEFLFRNFEIWDVCFLLALRKQTVVWKQASCSAGFCGYKNMENVIKDTGCFLRYKLTGFDSSVLQRGCWRSHWRHDLSALVNKEHH